MPFQVVFQHLAKSGATAPKQGAAGTGSLGSREMISGGECPTQHEQPQIQTDAGKEI
eukprot:CAMPEP_0181319666 /NCGR_PEP_ID=MMETSP1101-20121128/17702_1 /TAXON_ID=46948 /ORGANISM="Rhodomonas abbreviata, Strain Caron Lab Isolate" /LENGTH=56 /DNA_ID=CAMNT_0023427299 /DNA_START=1293 /DNA_END=1463 /DNA_ORIENTATION=-